MTAFLLIVSVCAATAGAQDAVFPLGVFLFGEVHVDLERMRSELGITWIQGHGGTGSDHNVLERNRVGISMISIRPELYKLSRSQRLVYEAEASWPPKPSTQTWTYSFFGKRETGSTDEGARVCRVPEDKPGYVVRQPRPDNRLSTSQKQFHATFRLRISERGEDDHKVATLCILCYKHPGDTLGVKHINESDFSQVGSFVDIDVPFLLDRAQNQPSTDTPCDSIDIQVYWHGLSTMWLDKVTVDDEPGQLLFSGSLDSVIEAEARDYLVNGDLGSVQRFYLADEPTIPTFLSFQYISNKLDSLFGGQRGWAVSSVYWEDSWLRWFIRAARPHEALVHYYVLRSSIPSPSINDALAESNGISPYVDNDQYTRSLQTTLDALEEKLFDAAQYSKEGGIPFWSVPQLHGEYIVKTGKYVYPGSPERPALRPPTGSEIAVQIGMAISFGARGIIGYPFGTDRLTSFAGSEAYMTGLVSRDKDTGGFRMNHSSDTSTFPVGNSGSKKTVYTGYAEKWEAVRVIYGRLTKLGPFLADLEWKGTKSWYQEPDAVFSPLDSEWEGLVSNVASSDVNGSLDANPAVVVGHFKDADGVSFLWVLNRRCDGTNNIDVRDIRIDLNTSRNEVVVSNVAGDQEWVIDGSGSFVDRFGPGEGKLYVIK